MSPTSYQLLHPAMCLSAPYKRAANVRFFCEPGKKSIKSIGVWLCFRRQSAPVFAKTHDLIIDPLLGLAQERPGCIALEDGAEGDPDIRPGFGQVFQIMRHHAVRVIPVVGDTLVFDG